MNEEYKPVPDETFDNLKKTTVDNTLLPSSPQLGQVIQEKMTEFAPLFLKGEEAVKKTEWEDLPIETKQYLTAVAKAVKEYIQNYVTLNAIVNNDQQEPN